MIRRNVLVIAAGAAVVLTGAANAGSRLYRNENAWYSVSNGQIAYTLFIADAPDGARGFGADTDTDAVYVRVKSTVPASFKRLGVTLSEPVGCSEAQDKNGRGVSGWAFTCVFPVATPAAAPATTVATATPAPAAPAQSSGATKAVASAPPPAAIQTKLETPAAPGPTPKPPAQAKAPEPHGTILASAAPTATRSSVTTPSAPAPAAMALGGDIELNARVKANLEAVEARNAARAAEFEAAKKATADAYAAQLAAYQAQVQETERKRLADLEAWKARVAACKAGDTSQCGQ